MSSANNSAANTPRDLEAANNSFSNAPREANTPAPENADPTTPADEDKQNLIEIRVRKNPLVLRGVIIGTYFVLALLSIYWLMWHMAKIFLWGPFLTHIYLLTFSVLLILLEGPVKYLGKIQNRIHHEIPSFAGPAGKGLLTILISFIVLGLSETFSLLILFRSFGALYALVGIALMFIACFLFQRHFFPTFFDKLGAILVRQVEQCRGKVAEQNLKSQNGQKGQDKDENIGRRASQQSV